MPSNPTEAPGAPVRPQGFAQGQGQFGPTDLMQTFNQAATTEAPGAPVQPQMFAQGQGQFDPTNLTDQFNQVENQDHQPHL